MTRLRLAAPAMVVYWLVLVAGLGLYTVIRLDDASVVVPLWIGAIAGTALGHLLATCNLQLWISLIAIVSLACFGQPFVPAGISSGQASMAFVPAALCAFWSLGDRASLAAFWFPAVIWMLSILDRSDGKVTDGAGLVLLGGLAFSFVLFLRARESRRVALWSTVATTRLAKPVPSTVLKEPPGARLARGAWALLVAAIACVVTAWVAPQLWHTETFVYVDQAAGATCCPPVLDQEITHGRIREYFDIGRSHDHASSLDEGGAQCVCGGAVALGVGDVAGQGYLAAPDGALGWIASGGSAPIGSTAGGTASPSPASIASAEVKVAPPVAAPAADVALAPIAEPLPPAIAEPPPIAAPTTPVEPAPPPRVDPPTPPSPPTPTSSSARPPSVGPTSPNPPHRASDDLAAAVLHWVVIVVAGALAFMLVGFALRPLRRFLTLRHLRRPFWSETVDQRISNSWQLALVGLRDAGWRFTSAESPCEFARRVGINGVARCATILERARHGIAIDGDDLPEMTASADAAYASARARIGHPARVLGWLRWPLA